ncbi:MAG: glycoside hydrolase [Thermodesulfobacterium geofontis]|uniref:Glycoside hydrolase n=2 Tax=Thermodesulfobacterium geofontis TaxID=1295609 RepID=A0A2N7PQJ2_9BACT|nr:MAG: glycoside hydrolase [Thermodesulfobacterium geofontis]
MKKVLFYRRGALGDTLLTFPIFEVFKKKGYYIVAIGNTDYLKIAKEINWVDEIYSDFYKDIFKKDYELRIIFSKNEGFHPFPSERLWIVDYYFDLLKLEKEFSFILPIKDHIESPLKDKVVLHPGSGSFKKIPHFSLFEKIEEYLYSKGFEVIYLVGEADSWIKNFTQNFWECLDPLIIAKALKGAKLFVGVDSGISHLASYLGIKSFIFFGPTDPVVWKPIGKNYEIISLNLDCSPCFPKVCEKRFCLDTESLFNAFLKFLKINKFFQ